MTRKLYMDLTPEERAVEDAEHARLRAEYEARETARIAKLATDVEAWDTYDLLEQLYNPDHSPSGRERHVFLSELNLRIPRRR